MSNPATSSPLIDPSAGLMISAASQLVPLFRASSPDPHVAREMAISANAAYDPESRADYINVARTIAFSIAALALLAKAAADDMPMPELMRVYGRANALNRSADQSERTMMRRRACQRANPADEPPARMDSGLETAEPGAPTDAAVFQAAVAEAIQVYETLIIPPPLEAPPPKAATPNFEPVAGQSAAAAIRYATPVPGIGLPSPRQNPAVAGAAQPPAAAYRTTLLRNTAMPPAALSPG